MTTTTTCHFHPTTKYYYISLLFFFFFSLFFFFISSSINISNSIYITVFFEKFEIDLWYTNIIIYLFSVLWVFIEIFISIFFSIFVFSLLAAFFPLSYRKRKLKLNSPFVCLIESKQRYSLFYLFEGKNWSCTKLKRLIILFINIYRER